MKVVNSKLAEVEEHAHKSRLLAMNALFEAAAVGPNADELAAVARESLRTSTDCLELAQRIARESKTDRWSPKLSIMHAEVGRRARECANALSRWMKDTGTGTRVN